MTDNTKPENRKVGYVLEYYLDLNEINKEEFYTDLRQKLSYISGGEKVAKSNFEQYILGHSKTDYLGNTTQKYAIWKSVIRILHFEYGISCELFGYSVDEFSNTKFPVLKPTQTEKTNQHTTSHVYELKSDPYEETAKVKFQETYYEYLKEPLHNMQKELIVFEYVEDVRFKDPNTLDAYYNSHNNIYLDIEKKLEEIKKFKYIRFLTLPLHHKLSSSDYDPFNNPEHKQELLSEIIKYISPSLFAHMYRSIKKHWKHFDTNHLGYYLVARPTRSYLWGTIDNGKYIITEYYKYNQDTNKCEPNLLFIAEKGLEPNKLFDIYHSDRMRLTATLPHQYNNPRVNHSDFSKRNLKKILTNLIKELKEEFKIATQTKDEEFERYNTAKIYLANAKAKLDIINESKQQ